MTVQLLDWPTLPLGSLLTDIQPGFASGKHNSTGEGLPHFRPMNVSPQGRIDRSVLKYVDPSTSGRRDLHLRRGDVLFNNTNSPELVGKTALFDEDDEPAFSNHMTRLRTDRAKLEPGYLALRLHQAWREGYFAEHCNNHVSQASVGRNVLRAFPIELPPLEVQRAITSLSHAVDSHRLSSGNHLAAARRAIERFRQAVLATACSGRLTADWRAGVQLESADVALERKRLAERQRLGKKYREPVLPDRVALPEVPETWCWATLPELGELGRGKSKHRPRNDPSLYGGKYPFIQTGDVARSHGRIVAYAQTYNERGLAQSRLWPERTVCITIAANIAESALLTFPACFPDSVVGLVADESVAMPEYVELFIQTAQRDLSAFAPATAQANINLAILSEVAVALPPIEEQREIVSRVEAMYAVCAKVEAAIQAATKRAERSSQAVLAKAFRGGLVAQADEAPTTPTELRHAGRPSGRAQ